MRRRFTPSGTPSLQPTLVTGLLLALGLVLGTLDLAAEEVEMKWRKADGQTKFDLGRASFEKGDYKEAYDAFKDAKKHASDRPTKQEVERWLDGARGGNELVELKKRAEGGQAAAAHQHAETNLRKYLNTPIGEEYKKFVDELERQLFTMLEDFDTPSKRYTEKYGKTFVDDAELVKQGKRALKWEVDKRNFELKVKSLPDDLTRFENGAVVFWLHFERRGGPYAVIFSVPGKSTSTRGQQYSNAYIKQMQPHTGWKRIEIPLKNFTAQGEVEWSRVKDFRIQFQGGKTFTCHIDAIALRK